MEQQISSGAGKFARISVNPWRATTLALAIIMPLAYWGGKIHGDSAARLQAIDFSVTQPTVAVQHDPMSLGRLIGLVNDLKTERTFATDLRQQAQYQLESLAIRVARLQARVMRVEALGQRLTEIGAMPQGEFDFTNPPPQGGPELLTDFSQPVMPNEFIADLAQLEVQLDDREQQMQVLEHMLLNQEVAAQAAPKGSPLENTGWQSSGFGVRHDPFTGRRTRHAGIDFAARAGTKIIAVGAGVVSFSGTRQGYGNTVEINHGNGYVTRYAHNQKNLVSVGQAVEPGQKIALLGSSGRATGPHVHFEVLKDGKQINPKKFVLASR